MPATNVADKPCWIGLDIGGTKIAGVVMGEDEVPLAQATVPAIPGEEAVVASAVAVVSELLAAAGCQAQDCLGIGIGIPGTVDRDGTVFTAVNLGIEELPLGPLVQEATGIRVVVDNDVNAAAVGAAAAVDLDATSAYLNIGTGMGSALVDDGRVLRGARGVAGEIGHLAIIPDGELCGCGQRGCLETRASGKAVDRLWPVEGGRSSTALLEAHLAGDPAATEVFQGLAEGIAQAIRVLVLTYDPDHVILGGGLTNLGQPLVDQVRSVLRDWEEESAFLASLGMEQALKVVPPAAVSAATGAALMARGQLLTLAP